MEKLGQFKSGLSAFLSSVQPIPKASDKDFDLKTATVAATDSESLTAVTTTGSLTENGHEKGFLTETLDDYDDRFVIHSFFLLDVMITCVIYLCVFMN